MSPSTPDQAFVERDGLRKRLASRPDPALEIRAEHLDGPGPRLLLRGRFESAPGQGLDGILAIGPLYRPSRTLAIHLVLPEQDIIAPEALPNGRLLLSIRSALGDLFGNPAMMAPVFAILRTGPGDSIVSTRADDGRPETRILMRGGALLWDDLTCVTGHARLSIPRRTDVLDYRIVAESDGA